MNAMRNTAVRFFSLAAFGILLAAGASAATDPASAAGEHKEWAVHRQEWMKQRLEHHLEKLANRLEIKASQQAAWQAYAKTIESVVEQPLNQAMHKPEGKPDAAGIARLHADMAAARAQKLAQIADATAKLQAVLTPEQRATLDQVAARMAHRRHFAMQHGGHWGEHGERGEHGEHGRDFDGEHNHG